MRQGEAALYGVSLTVPKGKRTAIIGMRQHLFHATFRYILSLHSDNSVLRSLTLVLR
jgi:hypothetical protein